MFFLLLWPLFARAPRHWFLENFLLSAPGVQSVCFFLLRSVGRRDPSAGPEQKKTPPRVCFFCSGPAERQGKEKPVPARGQSKKKHHPGCFFFCSGPGERQGKEKPRAGTGPEQKKKTPPRVFFFCYGPGERQGKAKKKHHPGCFFCSGPGERQGKEKPRWAPARGQSKKKNTTQGVFFLLWPRAGAQRGFSFPCLSPGPEQKKHTLGGVFFALAPCRHGASPSPAFPRGRSKKKKHPGWCFFLLRPRADAHSLTAGLGGDASPSPGWCFFFLLRPRPDRGGVFFCCGPARTLTHSLWAGAISARPGWCFFFLLRPRRVFLDNNKKCLGYYIGSKKTRRGHSKKKKHHFRFRGSGFKFSIRNPKKVGLSGYRAS